VEILDPRAPRDDTAAPAEPVLDRAVAGVVVGLRLDHTWDSYKAAVDVWRRRLTGDAAVSNVLWTGERVGDAGEKTRADLAEWSRLVDCGVVGLGN
jgi:hypothetical protein